VRTYTFLAGGPGRRRGYDFWPSREVVSTARIRVVTAVLFRKWFGRRASLVWHLDGQFAGARDKRGNFVDVEQINHYHRCSPGATQMRRPLCPMVIKKGGAR